MYILQKTKVPFSDLVINLTKTLAEFCNMPGQPNTPVSKRPVLEARDKILLERKPKITWCIDRKKLFLQGTSNFSSCTSQKNPSCMTILIEMGIKRVTSKAARSQLLTDTSQVPEAHSKTSWKVMQYMDLTFSMYSMGHETEQKVTAVPCTN